MIAQTFELRPAKAAAALATFASVPGSGEVVFTGPQFAQAKMLALLNAELLAAEAGVVPFVVVNGRPALFQVGQAREVIETPEKWHAKKPGVDVAAVQTLYLSAHGASRHASAVAQPAPAGSQLTFPEISGLERQMGVLGVDDAIVVLAVLGVAAIVAGAWYAATVGEARVRADAETVRHLATVDAGVKAALAELQATGHISGGAWDFLKGAAEKEKGQSPGGTWKYFAGAGAVVLVGYGAFKLLRAAQDARAVAAYGVR